MHYIELLATLFGFICTWFSLKQDIKTWPCGIVAVVLYAILFHDAHLYADLLLQIIYCGLMLYGWLQWREQDQQHHSIKHLPKPLIFKLMLIGAVSWFSLYYFLSHYTTSQCVAFDAATTVASLIASWLLAKKYIATWYVWFVTDVVYVMLYIYKQLYVTSLLYIAYTILAVLGYYWWQQARQKQAMVLA